MLDKLEPPAIPDGYGVSVAYYCLLDIIRSIHLVMMGPNATAEGQAGKKERERIFFHLPYTGTVLSPC